MEDTYLQDLNPQQLQAVQATEGRIRVIAGAGSGKTKTLACRFAYLINEFGISPAHILCLTFTNKAANEMRQRIKKMVDDGYVNDLICTIHGFCVKVLRRDIYRLGFSKNFIILDEEDRKGIAKKVFEELNIERKDDSIRAFLSRINTRKSQSPYIEDYMLPSSSKQPLHGDVELYAYIKTQLEDFSLDFTDLITFALYLLKNFEDVREYWQKQIEYILLDEAQDCNDSDWDIVEILSQKHNNLFIVGDPDQAIYTWRGANVEYFLNFKNDKTIILNQNYRSTPNILNVANSIIQNNKDRIKKDLFTSRPEGKTIIHYHGKDDVDEMKWVVKQLIDAHNNGISYKDCCILYRAASMTRLLEQELINAGLPYKIYGGIRFYERKEIKDALAYLRLVEKNDDLSFRRVINEPSRKIGKVFVEKIENYAKEHNFSLFDALKEMIDNKIVTKDSAIDFVNLIQAAKSKPNVLSIAELLDYLLTESGYTEALRVDGDEDRLENLEELTHSIKYYEKANENDDISLTTFLQDIALYTNTDEDMSAESVKLMTIHQAKGLEFPCVFVIGLFEGGLPNYRALRSNTKAIEEERRIMYVAVTRAENILFLTESEGYDFSSRMDKYPSQFLKEIKRDFFITEGKMDPSLWKQIKKDTKTQQPIELEDEYYVNNVVEHKHFGYGKIVKVNDDGTCDILFKCGTRTLVNSAIDVIDDGDERDIDFDSGYPVDEADLDFGDGWFKLSKIIENKTWEDFVGRKLHHPVWGDGVVKSYEKEVTKRGILKEIYYQIEFEKVGLKKISAFIFARSLGVTCL